MGRGADSVGIMRTPMKIATANATTNPNGGIHNGKP